MFGRKGDSKNQPDPMNSLVSHYYISDNFFSVDEREFNEIGNERKTEKLSDLVAKFLSRKEAGKENNVAIFMLVEISKGIWYNINLLCTEGKITIYKDKKNEHDPNRTGLSICVAIKKQIENHKIKVEVEVEDKSRENPQNQKECCIKNIKELLTTLKEPKKPYDDADIIKIFRDKSILKEDLARGIKSRIQMRSAIPIFSHDLLKTSYGVM